MPRRKLSEYQSKIMISEALNLPYVGWNVDANASLDCIANHDSYVVKVDQAVKGRFKKGLVLLDVKKTELKKAADKLRGAGYGHFIVEPYILHAVNNERYLSISRDRGGYHLSYSSMGGIEIESHTESIEVVALNSQTNWSELARETKILEYNLRSLLQLFIDNHFVFLEINPYIVEEGGTLHILDAAVEVDDAGIYFTHGWQEGDLRDPGTSSSTSYEKTVRVLDAKSPASFNLSVLNPSGSIFLLLSGGGASVVVADEVFNRGLGDKLANYGEYSGNPTSHETYVYTVEVLKLLLASSSSRKILFIGGAVANFTDIASTFAGVIKALTEYADQLSTQKVKVFVRRGGPRQEIGLAKMQTALEQYCLYGGVYDPKTSITDALDAAFH